MYVFHCQEKYRHYTEHHLLITLYHVAYPPSSLNRRRSWSSVAVYLSVFVQYMYLNMEIAVALSAMDDEEQEERKVSKFSAPRNDESICHSVYDDGDHWWVVDGCYLGCPAVGCP